MELGRSFKVWGYVSNLVSRCDTTLGDKGAKSGDKEVTKGQNQVTKMKDVIYE